MRRDVHFKVGFVSVVMRVIEKKGPERRRLTPIPISRYSDPNESGIFHLLPPHPVVVRPRIAYTQ